MDTDRRRLLIQSVSAGTAIAAGGAISIWAASPKAAIKANEKEKEPEVTATEDLMREHGVLRRALIAYAETATKLNHGAANIDAAAIHETTRLFQDFGEHYHERLLEEQHIFPVVRKRGGSLASYADILTAQHARGREITNYIFGVTAAGKIAANHVRDLARVLHGFVRMYQSHAAREDTIVFPAWKESFTDRQIDELGEEFEEIEKKTFGKDGFDDAQERITRIEARLGIADLAAFTPPPPPRV